MESCIRKNPCSSFCVGLLLTLITLAIQLQTCKAANAHPLPNVGIEFIRSSCGVTPYPGVCFKFLSKHASVIQTSPKHLANTALSVSLNGARFTSDFLSNLSAQHGLKPRESGAMKDCIKTMHDSVDQLRRSLKEMGHLGGPDSEFHMSNIRTWISAALTDDDTCMDGFAGYARNSEIKNIVRRHVQNIVRLTSNALALVTHFTSIQANLP